ncbi:MAG: hypothetical protein ACXVGO_14805 [Mycobacterium sp.]
MFLDTQFGLAATSADWSRVRRLRRNSATRGFAAALAVVALAGQLSSFAHLVLVRHVTCAEHGDMIEVGHERALVATAARRHAPATVVGNASEADSHGHEHCLIAPMRRDRLAVGTPISFDSAHIDAYGTIGRVGADEIAPPIAIVVLAPKNSPPLA